MQVCLVTLRLFDTLLQKEEEHIFHNLVLRNLIGRAYFQPSASSDNQKIHLKSESNASSQNEMDSKDLCLEPKQSGEGLDAGSPSSPSPASSSSSAAPIVSVGSTGELAGEWVSNCI